MQLFWLRSRLLRGPMGCRLVGRWEGLLENGLGLPGRLLTRLFNYRFSSA